ncbi:MAG: ribonuclease Y [bacterium]|nr:ribonuclease Y [bacterium]
MSRIVDQNVWWVIAIFFSLLSGITFGYFYRKYIARIKIGQAEEIAKRIIEENKERGEAIKKEALLEAKEEIHQERAEVEREIRSRRAEIQKLESRFLQKEENIDRRMDSLSKKEKAVLKKEADLSTREEEIGAIREEQLKQLEQIAGLSPEEARKVLLRNVEAESRHEVAKLIRQIEEEAKETADKKGREIITQAIQRSAAEHTMESTVSVVSLPSDEMKGRIIGREGRNIRTLETLTGVDLIIDDTPEAVIISGFDIIRREIARVALEKLIADGRIHPSRIEEVVVKAREDIERSIKEEGEQACIDMGVHGLPAEAVRLLGKLKYRTSFGQNVLSHSKEVARLGSIMAAELGANVALVKRAGLLHDVGKAIDAEVEGPHALIGADIARKLGESKTIVNVIASHHMEESPRTVEAVLIQAADAISAARPGARRENLETYVKRLEKLEGLAASFRGVEKAFAIQAGREVRVIIQSEDINDDESAALSRDIAKKIEVELEYPGQIKVTVIRETRFINYAK